MLKVYYQTTDTHLYMYMCTLRS